MKNRKRIIFALIATLMLLTRMVYAVPLGSIVAAGKTYAIDTDIHGKGMIGKFGLAGDTLGIYPGSGAVNLFTYKSIDYKADLTAKTSVGKIAYGLNIPIVVVTLAPPTTAPVVITPPVTAPVEPVESTLDPVSPGVQPSAANTGAILAKVTPAPTGWKPASNSIYTNLHFSGLVNLNKLSNVTLINCEIDGGGKAKYGVECVGCSGITIQNSEIVNVTSAGIYGDHFTATGNCISQSGGDGIKPISDAVIESNYITKLGWHSPLAHADGVQIRGGKNIRIVGNFFDLPNGIANTKANSSLFLQLNATNVTFESNWVRGGNFAIHAFSDTTAHNATVMIDNNVFYAGSTQFGFGTIGAGVVWKDNVTDSGAVALNTMK